MIIKMYKNKASFLIFIFILLPFINLWPEDSNKTSEKFPDIYIGFNEGHSRPIHFLAISPDGTYLVTGGNNIKLWNFAENKLLITFPDNFGPAKSIAFSSDGKRLLLVNHFKALIYCLEIPEPSSFAK